MSAREDAESSEGEQTSGDEEEQDGDEEGAPGVTGKGRVVGLAGLIQQGVMRAVEQRIEGLSGEDFRSVFLRRTVHGEQPVPKVEDAGFMFGVSGVRGAGVIQAAAGFTGQKARSGGTHGGSI